ncbi:E-selectin [Tupaia chinensis]|uniref:E-selectin n=1 Tax=Tupaia chinensis TaxID=246437 RepID=UPI0003C92286|nr:E-selectin [Tupaia chinensis]
MTGPRFLSALTLVLLAAESSAWSYSASTETMTYDEASAYCRGRYTHLVAIQNKQEIEHLNRVMNYSASYYWIGIRKVNGVWVWVGTQKPLTKEAANWAPGEPNNKKKDEDCVEIYIRRGKDEGMWNDEPCSKKKLALCYTAACTHASCSGHGECVETIENYTCECHPGFSGPRCEQAVQCSNLTVPEKLNMSCSGKPEFGTVCEFACPEGWTLNGSAALTCNASGHWSEPLPTCQAPLCRALSGPEHGYMDCLPRASGTFQHGSSCEFSCDQGFVPKGSRKLQCGPTGQWDGEEPTCEAVKCDPVDQLLRGTVRCSHPTTGNFTYNSSCAFSCEEGFSLQGSPERQCTAQGRWTQEAPFCQAVQCSNLTVPEKLNMSCSGKPEFGTVCEFTCPEGWTLNGSAALTCNASGHWSEPLPTCQAPPASNVPLVVGLSTAGTSVVGLTSFLLWLLKHLRRKAKKFIPASRRQSLESNGSYHMLF